MNEYSETAIRVRYAETDQMGVVHHANYFVWFELGRVEWCREHGFEYSRMETVDDTLIVVAEAHCRYRRPARFDDQLVVRTRLSESQRRVVKFEYELVNQLSGEMIATGGTVHVICDKMGRPKSLPEKYRAYFSMDGVARAT